MNYSLKIQQESEIRRLKDKCDYVATLLKNVDVNIRDCTNADKQWKEDMRDYIDAVVNLLNKK